MKKINIKGIGTTMFGAGGGAYIGEMAADKVVDMVDSDMMETGALIIGGAVGAWVEDTQKGIISKAGAGFAGEFVKTVLKKYIGGDSAPAPAPAAPPKKIKGTQDELGAIYDEINKALEGANDPLITGTNDPIIMGMSDDVNGFEE